MWQQNNCFSLYRKDVCNFNLDKDQEVSVKLPDLLTAWLLLCGLLIVSTLILATEVMKTNER